MDTKHRIAIIGTGPSGITALKNLRDAGLDAMAFDRQSQVGGNWVFNESTGHSSVFETTHIISSKTLSEYDDYPWTDHGDIAGDYPSHQDLAAYFQAYAQHFNLHPYIHFETEIVHCERLGDRDWQLVIERGGERRIEKFSHLIVANGHHWDPRMPEYPGEFAGEFLHSHNYKKAEPFRDQRVLVIGGGNSACDVAVETSRVSSKTDISWRRGYRIVPKFLFGKPTDVFMSRSHWLPSALRIRMGEFLLKLIVGPNKSYGLEEPKTKIGETHPTVNDELLYRIRHGKVHPKGDIDRFDGHTVHFKDGSQEEYDSVVACTGFKISHPFLDKDFINYSEGDVPLYLKMMHPQFDDIYFIGLFQPLGCIWPLAELQAKIVARELTGKWNRPKDMPAAVQRELDNPDLKQINTPRHTITVDYHAFRKRLLRELPKNYISREAVKEGLRVTVT